MASEILSIPEEDLLYVIKVIQCGIRNLKSEKIEIPDQVVINLIYWCEEEMDYLDRIQSD